MAEWNPADLSFSGNRLWFGPDRRLDAWGVLLHGLPVDW